LLAFGDQPRLLLPDAYNSFLRTYTIRNPDSMITPDRDTYIDSAGHAHAAYGITTDALILVRPDGYVGLTAGNLSSQPIIEYLRRFIA